MRAGCLAWVRLAGDPVVQRILLIDAPSVLGMLLASVNEVAVLVARADHPGTAMKAGAEAVDALPQRLLA